MAKGQPKNTASNSQGTMALAEPSYLLQQAWDSLTQLKHKKLTLNPRSLAADLGTLLSQIPVDPSNLFLSGLYTCTGPYHFPASDSWPLTRSQSLTLLGHSGTCLVLVPLSARLQFFLPIGSVCAIAQTSVLALPPRLSPLLWMLALWPPVSSGAQTSTDSGQLTQAFFPTVDYYFPHPPPQKPDVGQEVDEEKEEMSESEQADSLAGYLLRPDVPARCAPAQLESLSPLLSLILICMLQAQLDPHVPLAQT